MLRVDFDARSAEAALDIIVKGAQAAVRPAAQAAAQVLYDEARARCPVSDHAHFFYGKNSKKSGVRYYFEPGSLRDSIYQAFSKDNSSEFGGGYRNATYHIAWNHRKVPYGHMVEFGTSRAAAHPFLRPAYDAKVQIALAAARGTFAKRLKAEVPGIT